MSNKKNDKKKQLENTKKELRLHKANNLVTITFKTLHNYKTTIIALATAYGFFSLLLYSVGKRVPFPNELSTLPTLLLTIAFSAVMLYFISFVFLFFPAAYSVSALKVAYGQKPPVSHKKYSSMSGLFVIFSALYVLFEKSTPCFLPIFFCILALLFFLATVIYAIHKINNYFDNLKDKFGCVLAIIFFNIMSAFAAIVVISFVWKIANQDSLTMAIVSCVVYLFFFFIVSFFLSDPDSYYQDKLIKYNNLFLLILSVPLLALSTNFAEITFRALRIGGGYETIYHYVNDDKQRFPKELISSTEEGRTKIVAVLIGIGEKRYVQIEREQKHNKIYVINASNICYEELPTEHKFSKDHPN